MNVLSPRLASVARRFIAKTSNQALSDQPKRFDSGFADVGISVRSPGLLIGSCITNGFDPLESLVAYKNPLDQPSSTITSPVNPTSTGFLLLLLMLLAARVVMTCVVRLSRALVSQSDSKSQLQSQKRRCQTPAAKPSVMASGFRFSRNSLWSPEAKGLGRYRLKVGVELNQWLYAFSEQGSEAAM